MKKQKQKRKFTRKKRVNKYQTAGMYADNTVAAAGQGGVGSTANIVYQQNDPRVLQQKLNSLNQATNNAVQQSEAIAASEAEQEQITKQKIAQAAAGQGDPLASGLSTAKSTLSTLDEASGGKVGEGIKGLFGKGQEVDVAGTALAGTAASSLAAEKAATSIAGEGFGNVARQKLTSQTSDLLAGQVAGAGETALNIQGAGSMGSMGLGPTPLGSTLPGVSAPMNLPSPPMLADTAANLPSAAAAPAPLAPASIAAAELGKETGKGLMRTTGFGASGVGTGLGKFATSGAGIGTIAGLAGMGISKWSDDNDPTKVNFGEGTGAALSGMGTGLGAAALAGSLMGSAVPVVGNILGAVGGAAYGLWNAGSAAKAARRAKEKAEREKKARVDKYNTKLKQNLTAARGTAAAGEIEQKKYSGYDLGRNVTARYGGQRYANGGMNLGMPRYGYAA
tara:strand:- start:5804 stop:7153 length:1350 start_codon:yes stop_codon:yes gene_type:complete